MAAQANIFDELSTRINKRQQQQTPSGSHDAPSSPVQRRDESQHPASPSLRPQVPPKKPQSIERVGSVPSSNKIRAPQAKLQPAKDEDSTRGHDQADASRAGKKGGFMKNLKKMFKRKKKGKPETGTSQLGDQYKARSEPELLSTREPRKEKDGQRMRLNTTDTALADSSIAADGNLLSGQEDVAGPSDGAFSTDDEGAQGSSSLKDAPQKIRTSLRKFNFSKKKRSSKSGDAPPNVELASVRQHDADRKLSPLPRQPKPNIAKRPSDLASSAYAMEYSDEFFTASLMETNTQDVLSSESLNFDGLTAVHASSDEQNVIAKDRIRFAPKDRRKPGKFQQRLNPRANSGDGNLTDVSKASNDSVEKSKNRLSSETVTPTARHSRGSAERIGWLPSLEKRQGSSEKTPGGRDSALRKSSQDGPVERASSEDGRSKRRPEPTEGKSGLGSISRKRSSKASRASDVSSSSSTENVHRTSSDSSRRSGSSTSSLSKKVVSIFESRRPLSVSLGVLTKMHEEVGAGGIDDSKKTKSVGTLAVHESIILEAAAKPDKLGKRSSKLPSRRSTSDLDQALSTAHAETELQAAFKRRSLADLPALLSSDVAIDSASDAIVTKKSALPDEVALNGAVAKRKSLNRAEHRSANGSELSSAVATSVPAQRSAVDNGNRGKTAIVDEKLITNSSKSKIASTSTEGSGARIRAKTAGDADHVSGVDRVLTQPVATGGTPQRSASEHANRVKHSNSDDLLPRPSSDAYPKPAASLEQSTPSAGLQVGRGKGIVITKSELSKVVMSSNSEEPVSVNGDKRPLRLPFLPDNPTGATSLAATHETVSANGSHTTGDSTAIVSIEDLKKKFHHPHTNSEAVDSVRYRSISEAKPRALAPPKPNRSLASTEFDLGTVIQSKDLEEEIEQPFIRSYSMSSAGTVLPSSLRKPLTIGNHGTENLVSPSKDAPRNDSDWLKLAKVKSSSVDESEDNLTNIKPSAMKRTSSSGAMKVDGGATEKCIVCGRMAYIFERCEVDSKVLHKTCAKCTTCARTLTVGTLQIVDGYVYCGQHKP